MLSTGKPQPKSHACAHSLTRMLTRKPPPVRAVCWFRGRVGGGLQPARACRVRGGQGTNHQQQRRRPHRRHTKGPHSLWGDAWMDACVQVHKNVCARPVCVCVCLLQHPVTSISFHPDGTSKQALRTTQTHPPALTPSTTHAQAFDS